MFSLNVSKFLAWSPALEEVPGCDFREKYQTELISPAQARRLSDLTKTSVDLAMKISVGETVSHIVFSSRHGEISRSVELLKMIAEKEALSPTMFTQSVHNTSIGIYTLFQKSHAATTAIGAGRNGFMMSLVSSYSFLRSNPGAQVLFIAADERIPDVISANLVERNVPYATAMLLRAEGTTGKTIHFSMQESSARQSNPLKNPQALDFAMWFYSEQTKMQLDGDVRAWSLEK